MSSSSHQYRGEAPMAVGSSQEIDSFKVDIPDIYDQFQIRDLEPLTMPLEPYFPELVQEFYASYGEQKDMLNHSGRADLVRPSLEYPRRLIDKGNQFAW
ncbi:hypothetical protein HAX54_011227, partial [Datura stramonium]|nr:hypothetical protein [Datura stramonium]